MCVTTRIKVKPYLKEYLIGKYCAGEDMPIQFPDKTEVYHIIWNLLEKRPVNVPVDTGNLEIILPYRREGKSPLVYNYLGLRSHRIIERNISVMMWSELHVLVEENKHKFGIDFIESVHYFMRKYCIDSLTEDAFLKNFYRWRDSLRKKAKKRCFRR